MRRLRQRPGPRGQYLTRRRRLESERRAHPSAVAAILPRLAVSLAKQHARSRLPAARAAASLLAVGLAAGCAAGSAAQTVGAETGNVITVSAGGCGTGWRHPVAGPRTFQIRNAAATEVEVTLIDSDNGAVNARVEGIGPGTTRPMHVDVGSGVHAFQCEGNHYSTRDGPAFRVPGHVRGGLAVLPVNLGQMIPVVRASAAYVASGLATLARQTDLLGAEIRAGDLAAAQAAWLPAHLTYERLGSAYGMFGDYDDEINGTPFGLPGGVHNRGFTGFYRLEYGLWHGQSAAELTGPADQLLVDVRSLRTAWPGMQLLPPEALSDLALRTHEVLENAMQFQLSGLDDFGSGTTLATAAAGIEATRAQLQILHPLLVSRDQNLPALYSSLDQLQRLIDAAKTRRGWTPVTGITPTQRENIDAAAGQTLELLSAIPPMLEASPINE